MKSRHQLLLALLCGVLTVTGLAANPETNTLRRVEFKEPRRTVYYLESTVAPATLSTSTQEWTRAWPNGRTNSYVELGSRVVLQVKVGTDLQALLKGRPLTVSRKLRDDLVILQASNSLSAIEQAAALAKEPGVVSSHPVMRRAMKPFGRYAPAPNDPYFARQWHLENRDTNGISRGADVNARGAWSTTRGAGVVVGVGDGAIQLTHPDLASRVQGQPHYNFNNNSTNISVNTPNADHATCVAGLIGAQANNRTGVSGVAPEASLATWMIWSSTVFGGTRIVSDEGLMDMFQYASNVVAVQNHSWGNASGTLDTMGTLPDIGVSNAVTFGRNGLGEVIVRAGGNDRTNSVSADEDGFASDPRVIAVAATRADGRVCSYSNQGSCILVAAPSGDPFQDGTEDPAAPNLVTTDLVGSQGYNTSGSGDSANYAFGDNGFNGTSGATPVISGVAALILGANPQLGYRDVQQILLQSARQYDSADPDVRTNGAGFLVSNNQGFGVPDAGFAVALAKHWSNRPAATEISFESTANVNIPTNVFKMVCAGPGLSSSLTSIEYMPSFGPHPDEATPSLPLVYVGQATTDLTNDLHGKAALIQRGVSYFVEKITRAANAGAEFAVVFDNTNETGLIFMAGTDFTPIPAVFISQSDGQGLVSYLQSQSNLTGQLQHTSANVQFTVTNTLSCEHVGVLLTTTSPYRSDLRITLVSPSGTRSVLQTFNQDATPGPIDWTYWSVHHFYESSYGTWRLEVSNELGTDASAITDAKLIIQGVAITDTDHDGLDDNWEMKWFSSLKYSAADSPGGDGYSNARKQCLDTGPTQFTPLVGPDVSFWNDHIVRVSFPAAANQTYDIQAATSLAQPLTVLTNLLGRLPEIETMVPYNGTSQRFFRALQLSQ